jgi:hypothetical protein
MEFLDQVWDGSAGEVPAGHWLCSIISTEIHGNELTLLYQQPSSVRAEEFVNENEENLSAIDPPRAHTHGRDIWAIDHGGDRRKPARAAAEAARTLGHSLDWTVQGPGPTAPLHDDSPSGALLPVASSGQNHQDPEPPGENP